MHDYHDVIICWHDYQLNKKFCLSNLFIFVNFQTTAATESDDFHREILRLLDLSGCYDEADVVPATHAVEASSYWLQVTPTLDEP